jgi:hypothetical protein
VAERTLRHIAISRKNWLFTGRRSGAQDRGDPVQRDFKL